MKRLFTSAVLMIFALTLFGQAKTPKLMVVPMDVWCQENGFWNVYENQGDIAGAPNYQAAVQDSRELMAVISKLNYMFTERGYSQLIDLSQSIKNIQRRTARNTLTASKTSGSSISSTPLDELNRQVKADIFVEVDWSVNAMGPKNSVSYILRALDAYTGEPVASAQATGPSSIVTEPSRLLEEAVVSNMDNFLGQLQKHFDDCIENGRKVTLEINVFDNGSNIDLEKEYADKELKEIIEEWVGQHAVKHQFLTSESTESTLLLEGVRIPLYKANGLGQDASGFANELRRYLKQKYNIVSKNNSPKLGYAQIIIGEK